MLRPETMSQAKILFLNDDSELVMDSLHKHGAFHLMVKEAEGFASSDMSYKVQDMTGRLREVLGKAATLIDEAETMPKGTSPQPIQVPDWPSFLKVVDEELSNFQGQVQALEADTEKAKSSRHLYDLWQGLYASPDGRFSPSYLNSFERLVPLLLFTESEEPADLIGALPERSAVFHLSDSPRVILVVCLPEEKAKVLLTASERGYAPLQALQGMPSGDASLDSFLKSYDAALTQTEGALKEKRQSISANLPRMRYLSSTLSDAYSVLSIKENSAVGGQWSILEGYVPAKQGDSLIEELRGKLKGRMIYSLIEEHSSPKVPVTFKYPKFIGLFDTITRLYGVPNYNEINPTPFLALTFPIFFGMMFGDIGHGVILAIIGLLFYKYISSLSKIGLYLSICGVFGSIMGAILYGEAFGIHIYSGLITPHGIEEDIMTLLTFALVIGVFQIGLGMTLGIANNLIQKKKVDAILVGIPRMALYFVSVLVIVYYGLDLTNWMGGPIYFLLVPLLAFVLAKPIYESLKHGMKKGLSALGEMGFETFDTLIRFISNTVSYLRIFAMVVAHVMLTSVFYILGEMAGGGVVGIALAVAGNIFVVLLEGIIVLAQDLRLHFYEWFSRFYDDGGVRFSPFRLSGEIPVVKK